MDISKKSVVSAQEALTRLREGNKRFIQNVRSIESLTTQAKRQELVEGQSPFAIILSCSDSRAPAEIIFDQGLGTLFIVRVAGNIVAPSLVGSVEFAAATFGTQLVVVMGHTRCGAITATLNSIRGNSTSPSKNIASIVHRIQPNIEELVASKQDEKEIIQQSIRANVRASVNHLRYGSELLEDLCNKNKLQVVGAVYHLETGLVEFFEEQT
jgi:carbonic anhydrase